MNLNDLKTGSSRKKQFTNHFIADLSVDKMNIRKFFIGSLTPLVIFSLLWR